MNYQDFQLSQNRLDLVSKHLAKKKVEAYVKENGVEPPADVEATFYNVTPEEKERYRQAFFASDFVETSDTYIEMPEVIKNTPEQDEAANDVIAELSSATGSTREVTAETLNNITIPASVNATTKIYADFENGATVESQSSKSLYINNTSEEPIDINILTKTTSVYLTGKFNNVYYNGRSIYGANNTYPEISGALNLAPATTGSVTVSATFDENASVNYMGSSTLRINNYNNEDANVNVYAPNSTVTINGQFDEVEATVSDETLILTYAFHCDTLKISNSKVIYQGTDQNDFFNHWEGENVVFEAQTKPLEQNLNLSTPGVYILGEDRVNSNPIVFGVINSGKYRIDLNGHNMSTKATREYACLVRCSGKMTVDIVDTVGGGGISSAPDTYCIWLSNTATTDTTVNIYGGNFEGYEHVLYTQMGTFNIYGGTFKCLSEDKRYTINCQDAPYTAGTANIKVYGGRFYNFDPSNSMSEPGGPVSFVAEGYKVVSSQIGDDTVYDVVPA